MRKLFVAATLALALAQVTGCTKVPVGSQGIVVNSFGSERGVSNTPIVTGMVFYNPLTSSVISYPTFKQTRKFDEFVVNSSEGAAFKVDPTITVNVIPGKTPFVYSTYRANFDTVINGPIQLTIQSSYRDVMNKYTSAQIMTERQKFEADLYTTLNKTLTSQGFQISQISSGLVPPSKLTDSINETQQAAQEVLLAEQKLKVAEANAKTVVMAAEGQAKANEAINSSLTPMLVQQQFIEKWDGHAPLYGQALTLFKNVN